MSFIFFITTSHRRLLDVGGTQGPSTRARSLRSFALAQDDSRARIRSNPAVLPKRGLRWEGDSCLLFPREVVSFLAKRRIHGFSRQEPEIQPVLDVNIQNEEEYVKKLKRGEAVAYVLIGQECTNLAAGHSLNIKAQGGVPALPVWRQWSDAQAVLATIGFPRLKVHQCTWEEISAYLAIHNSYGVRLAGIVVNRKPPYRVYR